MREVEPEERSVDGGIDLSAVLAGEERRVADEERGIGGAEHGEWTAGLICSLFGEGGLVVVEVFEEDVGVGVGAAAGGIRGYAANVLEGFVGGEVRGIFDEEEDAADFVKGRNGAAGDDGERGGEGCDGDQAEVGGARVQFGCADGGQRVVHVVVFAQTRGCGFMFKVVEQWGGVQKRDGGDA